MLKNGFTKQIFLNVNNQRMSGQKNTGNKGRKRESGVAVRHKRLITNLMDDLFHEGKVDGVHIGRVTKKLGNGRVEVFYVATEKDEEEKEIQRAYQKQAVIKGSFRGRGKHSVWVEIGGIVVLNDTDVGILEIAGILTQDQLNTIAKTSFVDERVLKPASTSDDTNDTGIEFTNEEEISDGDIANI